MRLSTRHSRMRIYHFRVRAQQRHRKDELQPCATFHTLKNFLFISVQLTGCQPLSCFCAPHSARWHTVIIHSVFSDIYKYYKNISTFKSWIKLNNCVIFFKIAKMLHSVIAVFSRFVFTINVMVFQLETLGLNRCSRTQQNSWSSTNHEGHLLDQVLKFLKVLEGNNTTT